MFGFSLGKLLVFLAMVVVSWGLFTKLGRSLQNKKKEGRYFKQDDNDGEAATLIWCEKCKTHHIEGECKGEDGS